MIEFTCSDFKKYYIDGDFDAIDAELKEQALNHFHSCQACSDASLTSILEQQGVNVSSYPCVHMAQYAEFHCDQHPDPRDCQDAIILYDERFDEYSIPHGDGSSQVQIRHCPWCGVKLPDGHRDRWFDELESLGYDNPWEQDIPKRFKSKQWRIAN